MEKDILKCLNILLKIVGLTAEENENIVLAPCRFFTFPRRFSETINFKCIVGFGLLFLNC
jgi:hypothetical protein